MGSIGIVLVIAALTGTPVTEPVEWFQSPESAFRIDRVGELTGVVWGNGCIELWVDSVSLYHLSRVAVPGDQAADSRIPLSKEVSDAMGFIDSVCPIGSTVYVNGYGDPGAPYSTAIIWCNGPVSLNQQLLDSGLMVLRDEKLRDA